MTDTYSYEQLDPATKAYLRDVRAMAGRGAPGMYFPVSSHRPVWALLAGVFVLAFFLWIASTSTKSPMAVAALQTAAVLLGGWLILYAFRRWLANADAFAGWFFYFDPAHAFIGEGETINVAALPADTEITAVGDGVRFMSEHDAFSVKMPNQVAAAFVADYYAAVDWVMGRKEGPWAGLPLAETGAVARYLVEEDAEPPSVQDTGLRFDDIPEEVTAVRKPKSGAPAYLAVAGVGLGLFLLFSTINPSLQDNRAFAAAKEKAETPDPEAIGVQGYRDYLLNERNTRHRDEAVQAISALYDKPINRVKAAATDPALSGAMAALLESLRGPEMPAVTLAVADKAGAGDPDEQPMAKGLRMRMADGIAKVVGTDAVVFVKKPADKPAMIDLKYQTAAGGLTAQWWLEVRLRADDEKPFAVQQGTVLVPRAVFPNLGQPKPGESPDLPSAPSNEVTEAVYKDVMLKLVGSAPDKVVVRVEEGDF